MLYIEYDVTRSRGYCVATANFKKLPPFPYRGGSALTYNWPKWL